MFGKYPKFGFESELFRRQRIHGWELGENPGCICIFGVRDPVGGNCGQEKAERMKGNRTEPGASPCSEMGRAASRQRTWPAEIQKGLCPCS